MNNIIETTFGTLEEMRRYAQGVDLRGSLDEYEGTARLSKQIIEQQLPGFTDKLTAAVDTAEREFYLTALANLVMARSVVFSAVSLRTAGGADTYKHEIESMRRSHLDSYHHALSGLFGILSSDPKYGKDWALTPYAKMSAALEIKTCEDFDAIYPIDRSYHFFYRSIPIQLEELLRLRPLFDRLASKEAADPSRIDYPTHTARLRLALVKVVVATAIERFDPIELPSPLRNYYDDTARPIDKSDTGLSARLRSEAESLSSAVSAALSDRANSLGGSCYNEQDKILFIP